MMGVCRNLIERIYVTTGTEYLYHGIDPAGARETRDELR
jgi:hypothetical protein